MIYLFWISLFIIIYTFVGYGILLFILVKIKRIFKGKQQVNATEHLPTVSILVAAYNEEAIIVEKIKNTLALNYPKALLQLIFITDGSNDSTADLIAPFKEITLLNSSERKGKMAAIKRAIPFVKNEIMVFTDANTFLNEAAIAELVKHYQNEKVGAVAGEKRIFVDTTADASAAGEGFYWKYESFLKKLDYELYSNVGAAGELFSIKTKLYQPVEEDTIIDDHMIAMRIAEQGYIIAYEPNAYAMETASANVHEELKRKIRIAAGGIQSIFRLKKAANPFAYFWLTFQYISHRVLRWTITPFLLITLVLVNLLLVIQCNSLFFTVFLIGQIFFYALAILGYVLETKNIKLKLVFIPYYFCVMNYAVVAGIFRYFKRQQSAAWEKSIRKS